MRAKSRIERVKLEGPEKEITLKKERGKIVFNGLTLSLVRSALNVERPWQYDFKPRKCIVHFVGCEM